MAQWFKLHHELLRDKKLRLMATELGMPPALVRGLWVDLLCFAQELDQDGYLRLDHEIPLTWELVCEELGADEDAAMRFLIAAAKYNLVTTHDGTLFITSWEERQAKPSDSPEAWRERKAKQREKSRENPSAMSRGTSRGTGAGPSRDREEEKREEKNTRVRARVPVDNSRTSALTCPSDGAELRPNIDRGPGLYCTVCDYELERNP